MCVGADGRVYLSDLGAAKKLRVRLSACHDFGSIVRLSTFVGSPAAMAPVRSRLSQSVAVVRLTLGGCLAWLISQMPGGAPCDRRVLTVVCVGVGFLLPRPQGKVGCSGWGRLMVPGAVTVKKQSSQDDRIKQCTM